MISAILLANTKQQEGCRLVVYLCPAGYPTIGWGHRCAPDEKPWTQAQADSVLYHDLERAQEQASGLCGNLTGRRLDALTDLVFNVGNGALDGENPNDPVDDAGVVKALRRGDWADAAVRYRQWNHIRVDGKLVVSAGLTKRREIGARWIEEG